MSAAHSLWLLGPLSAWHWLIIAMILGMLMRPPWQGH